MNKKEILLNTQKFIHRQFSGEGTGHDYFHVERVVNTAKKIAAEENADLFLVELSAWLHDLGDYKLHDGVDKSKELISGFLLSLEIPDDIINKVIEIVSQVSFTKGKETTSLEAEIVQDADRLDAIGAIGIARCFAFGGSREREIWNPQHPEESSIQHFYDKLLRVKDLINTDAAKKIAEERHRFLEEYLKQFYKEWG